MRDWWRSMWYIAAADQCGGVDSDLQMCDDLVALADY